MSTIAQKKLLNYAARLLARRNYHSITLREKLTKKGIGSAVDVETVIERLQELRYINDADYLAYYINDQLTLRPQGLRLVRQKLMRRGIKGQEVEQELAKHEHREPGLALKAAKKKQKLLTDLPTYEQNQKLFRFLASRGFSIDTIKQTLQKQKRAVR